MENTQNMESMFLLATKKKLRFHFKGLITVEDLWDLKVNDLDSVFMSLNSQLKEMQGESLLRKTNSTSDEIELKINIIKYIVNVKQMEAVAKAKERENREKKQQIMSIIASKSEEELKNKSVDELQALYNQL